MAEIIVHRKIEEITPRRRITIGVVLVIMAGLMTALFAVTADPNAFTTFGLTPGGISRGVAPDLVLPTMEVIIALTALVGLAGIFQLARGFGRYTNLVLGVSFFFLIFALMIWTASGKSLNLAGLLKGSLLLSVPIALGALSGVMSERSGVVNIAIEGMMLMGAMTGALFGSITKNFWIGLLAALIAGLLMAAIHAVLSIKYKVDQIISGTVINIFGAGLSSFISSKFMQTYENLNNPPIFPRVPIPGLADIPFLGPILFNNNIFVYVLFILLIVMQIALFKTRWGLRLRSVGEHPKAADTLGINVIRTRYMAVLLSGVIAGFGGAYFTLGSIGRFEELMTAGKGFIGLAAMIFGNYSPVGTFGASMLFGFFENLGPSLSLLGSKIPNQFTSMLPYIATMVILAGVVGRGQVPAADGIPYEKE